MVVARKPGFVIGGTKVIGGETKVGNGHYFVVVVQVQQKIVVGSSKHEKVSETREVDH